MSKHGMASRGARYEIVRVAASGPEGLFFAQRRYEIPGLPGRYELPGAVVKVDPRISATERMAQAMYEQTGLIVVPEDKLDIVIPDTLGEDLDVYTTRVIRAVILGGKVACDSQVYRGHTFREPKDALQSLRMTQVTSDALVDMTGVPIGPIMLSDAYMPAYPVAA